MSGRPAAALGLVLVLVLGACGGNDDKGADNNGAVGTLKVESDDILVGEKKGISDAPLFRKDRVTSDANGIGSLSIAQDLSCDFRENSIFEIVPGESVILTIEEGRTQCSTKSRNKPETFNVGDSVTVSYLDPVFGISAAEDKAEVRVSFGFVSVAGKQSPDDLILGPGGLTTVAGGRTPEPAVPWDTKRLDAIDQRNLDDLLSDVPPADYDRPDPGSSPTLGRLSERNQIRLAIDSRRTRAEENFVGSLARFLSEKWKVGLTFTAMPAARAGAALDAGELDGFVSKSFLPQTKVLPFLGDPNEVEWFLSVKADEGFQDSILDFLKVSLDYGEYGSRYLQAFGKVPTYEAVRQIVYPDRLAGGPAGVGDDDPWDTVDQAGRRNGTGNEVKPSPTASPRTEPTPIATPTIDPPAGDEFRVTAATLDAEPINYVGGCPTAVKFSGAISTTGGPGRVQYRFLDSDGVASAPATLSVESGSNSTTVGFTREVGVTKAGWQKVDVTAPNAIQSAESSFSVECRPVVTPPPAPPDLITHVLETASELTHELIDQITGLLNGAG